ncbi:MAG TPA: TldD/PmbA family protein [Candidatus Sulfopaludibacter sp.]|jgi:predicted Zn-dependent protease|nr:TldD/PmbA family protein [Candidatus Sulfopaludibacter sp.]
MPGRAAAGRIFEQVQAAARALGVRDVEAMIATGNQALTRFANNAISQNVAERTSFLSVRPVIEGRTARASTNRLDGDSIRGVVEEAVALTRLCEPDPELLPLAGPADYPEVHRHYEATARATPEERALAVAEAIAAVEDAKQVAAGIYSTGESSLALLNSSGVSAWYNESLARFSITAMAADSSGWAKGSACYHGDLDPVALAHSAARKAAQSAAPRELEPGRYTVILEPAAVLDLVGQMFGDFSATAIQDGRSFLNDRIGKKIFGENITIRDDVEHPRQAGAPFDGEGARRKGLTLVNNGTVQDIAYCRQAAAKAGVAATGHGYPLPNEYGEAPANIVIAGGDTPVDAMIAGAERAILVTRLWYIREVDPYDKIFTGMTRDGTFLVEGGRVTAGVRNFRFNQSLIEMLSNVEALSSPVRASGEESFDMVAPAMKVSGFNFTEVTRF